MSTFFLIRRMIVITFLASGLALIAWFTALPTHAADQSLGAPAQAFSTNGSDAAAGAVEDTLKACMTRIPKDASIGQRMMAEESCQRDDADRKSIQAVPGTEYASQ